MFKPLFLIVSLSIGLLHTVEVSAALPLALNGQKLPSLAPMLKQVTPAVVNIATRGKKRVGMTNNALMDRFFNARGIQREQITKSLGSGVIVDAGQGYILTNNHVIEGAFEITATLTDGRELYAEIIGSDPDTDIAVIKIKPGKLKQIVLADSSLLEVGDFAIAIGNPFGLGQTVTSGIVSALGRSGLGIESYEDFIQTDASINLGSSGGALVNLRGELVGINTAILGSGANNNGNIGIGFAIPINMAKEIMHQLITFGEVKRGRLGAKAQDLTPQLATALKLSQNQGGVVVTQVEHDSSAYAAGLQVADVITHANKKIIKSSADMHNLVGLLRINQKVDLQVLRDGQTKSFSVEILAIESPNIKAGDLHKRLFGAVINEIKKSDIQLGDVTQLLLDTLSETSPAWQLGLREGDEIIAINKYRVQSIADIKKIFNGASNAFLLQLKRAQKTFYILLPQY